MKANKDRLPRNCHFARAVAQDNATKKSGSLYHRHRFPTGATINMFAPEKLSMEFIGPWNRKFRAFRLALHEAPEQRRCLQGAETVKIYVRNQQFKD
jgi:hypothetical protein